MNGVDRPHLIRLMVGRDLASVFPKREVPLGEIVLETRALGCGRAGVAPVSLHLRAGEILGMAGLVGSGRTEFAEMLFGLTPADTGQLFLHGQEVQVRTPADAIRHGLALVPEDRRRHGVVPEFSVAENLSLASLPNIAPGGWLRFAAERARAQAAVEQLAVKTASLATPVTHLSGGNQQKVSVGRWLETKPAVLILDEPTQGVDIGAKAEIHRLMGDLAAQGLAILMISSELPEVLGLSDRVAVMHAGRLAGVLERAAATPDRVLSLALGSAA